MREVTDQPTDCDQSIIAGGIVTDDGKSVDVPGDEAVGR
jgi:hypothetical protein